jgi:hypothetical protein
MSERGTRFGQTDPAGSDGYVSGEWDDIRDAYMDGQISEVEYERLRVAQAREKEA